MSCQCETVIGRVSEGGELAQMIATLASYDRVFGPVSMPTLTLATRIGESLAESGETELGRRLLERVSRDAVRAGLRAHPLSLAALTSLRNLHLRCDDPGAAIAVQNELASCRLALEGPEAQRTVEEKSRLGSLLMGLPAAVDA